MQDENDHPGPGIRGVVGGHIQPCQPTTSPGLIASIEPLATKADLGRILQIDSRTIDRMRSSGKMPAPTSLSSVRRDGSRPRSGHGSRRQKPLKFAARIARQTRGQRQLTESRRRAGGGK